MNLYWDLKPTYESGMRLVCIACHHKRWKNGLRRFIVTVNRTASASAICCAELDVMRVIFSTYVNKIFPTAERQKQTIFKSDSKPKRCGFTTYIHRHLLCGPNYVWHQHISPPLHIMAIIFPAGSFPPLRSKVSNIGCMLCLQNLEFTSRQLPN